MIFLIDGAVLAAPQYCWKPASVTNTTLDGEIRALSTEGIAGDPDRNLLYINNQNSFGVLAPLPNHTLQLIRTQTNEIPSQFVNLGYRHLGDSCYTKKWGIVSPLSPYPNKVPTPAILGFDPVTLEYNGLNCVLDKAMVGEPWVSVSGDLLYTSNFWNAPQIYVYELPKCGLVKTINLSFPINDTQGGVLFPPENPTHIFIGTNDDCVYNVEIATGVVTKSFCITVELFEMEGLGLLDLTSMGMGTLHLLSNRYNGPKPNWLFHFDSVLC